MKNYPQKLKFDPNQTNRVKEFERQRKAEQNISITLVEGKCRATLGTRFWQEPDCLGKLALRLRFCDLDGDFNNIVQNHYFKFWHTPRVRAPLEQNSFYTSKKLYFSFLKERSSGWGKRNVLPWRTYFSPSIFFS